MQKIALVATRKGLFQWQSEKDSAKWEIQSTSFEGAPVSMVLASSSRPDWYAALDHGHFGVKLHRSMDQGKSWEEITCPAYPASEGEDAPSLVLIWSMEYAGKDSTNGVWAGTIPGGLFYSGDRGNSWQLNTGLWNREERKNWHGGGYDKPGIHSICVHPDDPSHVTLAVSSAGVWVTRDGGNSWNNQSQGMRAAYMPPELQYDPNHQDPHRLVNSPADPSVFWVQHHNGIFKSDNDSVSWEEIKDVDPSVFGFSVVVHPQNSDIAWFVPGVKDECRIPVNGKLVVTRTKDGGKTFESLTQGLPQQQCYDLVYRHGLSIDDSGDCLMMGSTTGNLWVSENGGENWQSLANHLPPIYCVRFVNQS